MPRTKYILKDGTKATGVTTILESIGWGKNAIAGWSNKLGREGLDYNTELRRYGDIGSCAHSYMESALTRKFVTGKVWPDDIETAAKPAVALFDQWRRGKNISLVANEIALVSERFRCGGTPDAVVRFNRGPLVLIDYKTSSAIRETYIAQVAAYIDMIAEVHGKTIEEALILRFGKDGTADELLVRGDMLDHGRELFQLALQIHRLQSAFRKHVASAQPLFRDVDPILTLPTVAKAVPA
jgi:hypothetical protein